MTTHKRYSYFVTCSGRKFIWDGETCRWDSRKALCFYHCLSNNIKRLKLSPQQNISTSNLNFCGCKIKTFVLWLWLLRGSSSCDWLSRIFRFNPLDLNEVESGLEFPLRLDSVDWLNFLYPFVGFKSSSSLPLIYILLFDILSRALLSVFWHTLLCWDISDKKFVCRFSLSQSSSVQSVLIRNISSVFTYYPVFWAKEVKIRRVPFDLQVGNWISFLCTSNSASRAQGRSKSRFFGKNPRSF